MASDNQNGWRPSLRDLIDMISKTVTVCMAVVAYWQYQQLRQARTTDIALETLARMLAADVDEAVLRLDKADASGDMTSNDIQTDLTRVMRSIDFVAMLSTHELADKCVVKAAVAPYAPMIQRLLERMEYPTERRQNFDLLVNRMADEPCPPSPVRASKGEH